MASNWDSKSCVEMATCDLAADTMLDSCIDPSVRHTMDTFAFGAGGVHQWADVWKDNANGFAQVSAQVLNGTYVNNQEANKFSLKKALVHILEKQLSAFAAIYTIPDEDASLHDSFITEYLVVLLRQLGSEKSDFWRGIIKDAMLGAGYTLGQGLYLWDLFGRPSYFIDADLASMLEKTDISKLPTGLLRLPYISVVLRFPENLIGNFFGHAADYGTCVLALLVQHSDFRRFHVVAFNEYDPKESSPWHGAHVDFADADADMSFFDTLECYQENLVNFTQLNQPQLQQDDYEIPMYCESFMKYILSCLIYISTSEADALLMRGSPAYADWVNRIERRPKKKRKSAYKRLKAHKDDRRYYVGANLRLIDRHVSGELDAAGEPLGAGTHASPKMHWRTGHYHVYHTGRGRQNKKVLWVKPVLVNAPKKGLSGSESRVRYQVR